MRSIRVRAFTSRSRHRSEPSADRLLRPAPGTSVRGRCTLYLRRGGWAVAASGAAGGASFMQPGRAVGKHTGTPSAGGPIRREEMVISRDSIGENSLKSACRFPRQSGYCGRPSSGRPAESPSMESPLLLLSRTQLHVAMRSIALLLLLFATIAMRPLPADRPPAILRGGYHGGGGRGARHHADVYHGDAAGDAASGAHDHEQGWARGALRRGSGGEPSPGRGSCSPML